MNKEILKTLFPEAIERIDEGKCPMCGSDINVDLEFEDNTPAFKEYLISGACVKCQDSVFNEDL